MKGKPKRDGSGKGVRANKGKGGCKTTRTRGNKKMVNNLLSKNNIKSKKVKEKKLGKLGNVVADKVY